MRAMFLRMPDSGDWLLQYFGRCEAEESGKPGGLDRAREAEQKGVVNDTDWRGDSAVSVRRLLRSAGPFKRRKRRPSRPNFAPLSNSPRSAQYYHTFPLLKGTRWNL